jgi:predicted AAA+ superfamily ATPase
MLRRTAEATIRDRLRHFPGVVLLGPRQTGKTTLARAVADRHGDRAVYLDLELPSDRAKLSDVELYLDSHEDRLVVLDEIHRAPGLFQVLRGVIDRRRRSGIRSRQFLLLGSASMDLMQQSAESLAGRISYVELTPFTVEEVVGRARRQTLESLWIRGGFPDSVLARRDQASLDWRLAFIQTYLERDLPSLGPRVPAETLHRFWQMLAHNQGQMLNAARLAASLGVSGQTVARYLDILVDLLLVRRLQPWARNRGKRLVRSPKVYVRDSGLVHALLGLGDRDAVLGHPVAGASWEGFVIEQLLPVLPPRAEAWFYRTSAGAEIDLLLDLGPKRRWAIEVKRSVGAPHPSKGFHLAAADVGATRKIVVYPGREAYRLDATTEVVPLGVLIRELGT